MRLLFPLTVLAMLGAGCGEAVEPDEADPKPIEAVGDAVERGAEDVGAVVHNAAATAGAAIDDAGIKVAVKAAFADDRELDAGDIEVSVDDGVVTLDGDVGTLGQKMHATDLANDVEGVRRVRNRLSVGR